MGIPPHVKCCGCCCSLHNGTAIGTGLYIAYLLLAGVVLPVVFWPEDVEQAKAFCAGTTPAYRQGNDINSALTRQSLCARRSAHPAPAPRSCLACRLQLVSRLRHLHQRLGRGGFGCQRGWRVRLDRGPRVAPAHDRHDGPRPQEARRRPQDCLEAARGDAAHHLPPADPPGCGHE